MQGAKPDPAGPGFLVLFVLTLAVAAIGVAHPDLYAGEAPMLAVRCATNDYVLLVVAVPAAAVATVLAGRGHARAAMARLGVAAYLLFFVGYNVFALPLGPLFVPNVAIVGLCILLPSVEVPRLTASVLQARFRLHKVVAATLVFVAVSGCAFWLSDVVPAIIADAPPESLEGLGLRVNPATVFDLAIMLPLCLIAGLDTWRGRARGPVLAIMMLTWLLLTAVSVITMELAVGRAGLPLDPGRIYPFAFEGLLAIAMLLIAWRRLDVEQEDVPG